MMFVGESKVSNFEDISFIRCVKRSDLPPPSRADSPVAAGTAIDLCSEELGTKEPMDVY